MDLPYSNLVIVWVVRMAQEIVGYECCLVDALLGRRSIRCSRIWISYSRFPHRFDLVLPERFTFNCRHRLRGNYGRKTQLR